jgi:hypothetical protein
MQQAITPEDCASVRDIVWPLKSLPQDVLVDIFEIWLKQTLTFANEKENGRIGTP